MTKGALLKIFKLLQKQYLFVLLCMKYRCDLIPAPVKLTGLSSIKYHFELTAPLNFFKDFVLCRSAVLG